MTEVRWECNSCGMSELLEAEVTSLADQVRAAIEDHRQQYPLCEDPDLVITEPFV